MQMQLCFSDFLCALLIKLSKQFLSVFGSQLQLTDGLSPKATTYVHTFLCIVSLVMRNEEANCNYSPLLLPVNMLRWSCEL